MTRVSCACGGKCRHIHDEDAIDIKERIAHKMEHNYCTQCGKRYVHIKTFALLPISDHVEDISDSAVRRIMRHKKIRKHGDSLVTTIDVEDREYLKAKNGMDIFVVYEVHADEKEGCR